MFALSNMLNYAAASDNYTAAYCAVRDERSRLTRVLLKLGSLGPLGCYQHRPPSIWNNAADLTELRGTLVREQSIHYQGCSGRRWTF